MHPCSSHVRPSVRCSVRKYRIALSLGSRASGRDSSSTIVRRWPASAAVRTPIASDARSASSSSSIGLRSSIRDAVAIPDAKLEQIRCSSIALMKPAAFVRAARAFVNDSAAS